MISPSRLCLVLSVIAVGAQAEPALTIYNQQFAVVRDVVPVELKAGVNELSFNGMTALAEPQSVIFRDPAGAAAFTVLTQSYRNDAVSQESLLSLFEGKTLKFLITRGEKEEVVEGKVIRGGDAAWLAAQRENYYYQRGVSGGGMGQPIIEMGGELRFGLPGQPIFPKLADDSILKPTLTWKIDAPQPAKFTGELGYITGGFHWIADYNVLAGERGDEVELVGWVGITNRSGTSFRDARVRLLAGEVNRLVTKEQGAMLAREMSETAPEKTARGPRVTEKTFDEYHLYSLPDPVTLRNGETLQVEFIRAAGIKGQRIYIYDGVQNAADRESYERGGRDDPNYGTQAGKSVWVMQEFRNDEANHLGMPLPRGRIRFYRHDGAQFEFTGENLIEHTAKNELIRVYTGDAFDLGGERLRADFRRDEARGWVEESFALKLRNNKKEPVEISAVEHLYRGTNWEITEKSNAFVKMDAQTVEFRVQVKPEEEKTVTYKVRYAR